MVRLLSLHLIGFELFIRIDLNALLSEMAAVVLS